MTLGDLLELHPGKNYRHLEYPDGVWISVLAQCDGEYWVQNQAGRKYTLDPNNANEPKWSVAITKKKEKYLAWFERGPMVIGVSHHPEGWTPDDVSRWHRLEKFDFEIEVYF